MNLNQVSGKVYPPGGMLIPGRSFSSEKYRFGFNGKENDDELKGTGNSYDFEARIFDPRIVRFLSVDPLASKYPNWSSYVFVMNDPINLIDPDGKEPIKPFVGTVNGFIGFFNKLASGIGTSRGNAAHSAMIRLGEVNWSMQGPRPANTAPFNSSGNNRYIYTERGGWIDMSHFMFYAGRAYQAKLDKQQAQDIIEGMKDAGVPFSEIPKNLITKSMSDPVGQAVQEGYFQERMDQFGATYSAYSYEDLPSDKYGADFAVNHFDPNNNLTFGEQLQNYMNNVLKATIPENAPNFEILPSEYPKKGELPSVQNHSTDPIYTTEGQ
jgi:RHS repeat-associated protein